MWPLYRDNYLCPALDSLQIAAAQTGRTVEVAGIAFSLGNNMARSCTRVIDTFPDEMDDLLLTIRNEILNYAPNATSTTLSAVGVRLHLDANCAPSDWHLVDEARSAQYTWLNRFTPGLAKSMVDMSFLRVTPSAACPPQNPTDCLSCQPVPGDPTESFQGQLISTDGLHPYWEGYDLIGEQMGQQLAALNLTIELF